MALTWTKTAGGHHTNDALCVIDRMKGRYRLSEVTESGNRPLFTGSLADCKAWAEGWAADQQVTAEAAAEIAQQAEMVEQLVSSDGTVIAEKDEDGRWQDVEAGAGPTDEDYANASYDSDQTLSPVLNVPEVVCDHPTRFEMMPAAARVTEAPGNTSLPDVMEPVLETVGSGLESSGPDYQDFSTTPVAGAWVDDSDPQAALAEVMEGTPARGSVADLAARLLRAAHNIGCLPSGVLDFPQRLGEVGLTPLDCSSDVVRAAMQLHRAENAQMHAGIKEFNRASGVYDGDAPGYNTPGSDSSQHFDLEEQTMATATTGKLKVDRTEARALFTALGYKNSKSWSDDELQEHLAALANEDRPELEEGVEKLRGVIEKALEAGRPLELGDKPRPAATASNGKPTAKKGGGKPKIPAANGEATTRKPREGGPSNKEVVYKEWLKKKDNKTPPAADHYLTLTGGAVKDTTIKGWISAWGRGENLPACAKS